MQTKDSFSTGNLITRIKIIGKSKDEGRPPVETVIDGHTEYGIRQAIIERPSDKTLDEVKKSANELLKEKGMIKRTTSLQGPDVPYLRKGDRIRVEAGTLSGYWFVKSINHNAADGKMSLKIDEDKEKNQEVAKSKGTTVKEYDTGDNDEYGGEQY